jgi:arylsulfatase
MRMISSVGVSVGYDRGSAVSPRYRAPFAFGGTLHDIEIQLVSPPRPGSDDATMRAELFRQ